MTWDRNLAALAAAVTDPSGFGEVVLINGVEHHAKVDLYPEDPDDRAPRIPGDLGIPAQRRPLAYFTPALANQLPTLQPLIIRGIEYLLVNKKDTDDGFIACELLLAAAAPTAPTERWQ